HITSNPTHAIWSPCNCRKDSRLNLLPETRFYGCKNEPASITGIVVACVCFFVPAFAVPSEIRSAEQSIVLSVNMFFAFSIAQLFLPMLSLMKCGLFIFFASFVAIMTSSFIPFLPERKHVPIEEMYKVWKEHLFWRKYMPVDDPRANVTSNGEPYFRHPTGRHFVLKLQSSRFSNSKHVNCHFMSY
ncbi:hypothetical protein D5086_031085, partial [Populus alba]